MSIHLEIVADSSGFAELQPEWDALLKSTPYDSPFLSHGRLFTWWELFGENKDLRIITCRSDDGRLVGVMPSYVTRIGRRVSARAMRFLGDSDVGSCDMTAFSVQESRDEIMEALREHVRTRPRPWDVLDFAYVDRDEPFLKSLMESAAVRVVPRCGSTQRINLPGDWDAYRSMLSPSRRKSLNAAMNKSTRLEDEIELITDPSEMPSAMHDFWRLHEMRMSKKMGPEFRTRPEYRLFTERYSRQLLAEGRLRLTFLRREGARAAVTYQFIYGDTVYGEKSGFDASHRSADLLRPLLGSQIRFAIENGYRAYDMMLGDEQYKQDWGVNEVKTFCHVRVYDASLNGTLRRGRDAVAERVEQLRAERDNAAAAIAQ